MHGKAQSKAGLESLTGSIRQARLARRWSQRDLSARAGLTQAQISRIETGETDLQVSTLIELARSLDLELQLVPKAAAIAVGATLRSVQERSDERSARERLATLRILAQKARQAAPGRDDVAAIAASLSDLEPLASAVCGPAYTADLDGLRTSLEGFLDAPPARRTRHARAFRDAAARLKELRNTLAHAPPAERPAYRLGEEDE